MKLIFVALSIVTLAGPAFPCCQDDLQLPKAGKNQEPLKQFEGTWDATGKYWMEEGKPPVESNIVMTASLRCNGLWLVYDEKGMVGTKPYEAHGLMGYDERKEKTVDTYVSTWSDEMQIMQGSWDEKQRILTTISRGLDRDGKPTRYKSVTEFTSERTHVYTISRGLLGQEVLFGKVEYRKREK